MGLGRAGVSPAFISLAVFRSLRSHRAPFDLATEVPNQPAKNKKPSQSNDLRGLLLVGVT